MNKMISRKEGGLGRQRGIKILQHNMQRSKIVSHEIRTQMKADGNEILLMQEPYSIEGKVPGLGTEIAICLSRFEAKPTNGSGGD
jgi:hypothetical protein